PARYLARAHPSCPGRRHASPPSGGGRGEGDEGADQDALPDGPLHLPRHVHRHPRPRGHEPLPLPEMSPELEKGFGTGLRVHLQRRYGEEPPAPVEEPAEQPEPEALPEPIAILPEPVELTGA